MEGDEEGEEKGDMKDNEAGGEYLLGECTAVETVSSRQG